MLELQETAPRAVDELSVLQRSAVEERIEPKGARRKECKKGEVEIRRRWGDESGTIEPVYLPISSYPLIPLQLDFLREIAREVLQESCDGDGRCLRSQRAGSEAEKRDATRRGKRELSLRPAAFRSDEGNDRSRPRRGRQRRGAGMGC